MIYQKICDLFTETCIIYQELAKKVEEPIINEIINRYIDFIKGKTPKNISDEVLKNKIKNTPVQIAIIEKLETVDLTAIKEQDIPNDIGKCISYIETKKNNYQFVIDCIDLLTTIELLSETEYESQTEFEKSEYAKLVAFEDEEFKKLVRNNHLSDNAYDKVMTNIEKYIDSLTQDQKMNLYIEMLTLSYDRNSFNYINTCDIVMKMNLETGIPMNLISLFYDEYQKIVCQKIFIDYFNQRLSTIYNDLKIIYNHPVLIKNNSKN